ncbi:MAG: phosphoribosylamine--glycine ligase [Nitrospinaceae bacterium]
MRVLVVGGGGREHALAWKIGQSPKVEQVYCAPGNAGTAAVAKNVDIPADRVDRLLKFAQEEGIGFTVVGPEQPLVLGIVDRFRERGLKIFGPTAKAAELEGSKVFAKDLMRKYGIPTGDYRVFQSPGEARAYVRDRRDRLVVKADGLAAGKGVFLCAGGEEAAAAIETLMLEKSFGEAGKRVVVEEFLEGPEISLLAFTDGETVLALDSAQDHKAAFDGDKGPNTGGMGAYSPAPVLTGTLRRQVIEEILEPTVRAMASEGRCYSGLLYAGLMLTGSGPRVLEFNARFGDPETQPLLLRMKSDIVPLLEACVDGTLEGRSVDWKPEPAVCVVMASQGYPGTYEKGKSISGLEAAAALPGVMVFHAGTQKSGGEIRTHGGRVLGVTALGKDTPEAIANAYRAVGKISWEGIHYRKDIGRRGE